MFLLLIRIGNGDEIQRILEQLTNQRTVPNIFINQKHVGGCDDLHARHREGSLAKMLEECPKE